MAEDSKWSRYSRVHREISVVSDWLPDAPDTRSLGSITREWLNLFIGNAGAIYFGLAQDISLSRLAANILGLAAGDSLALDTLLLDAANRDISLSRRAANKLQLAAGDHLELDEIYLDSANRDVRLYRSAANVLKTDDNLDALSLLIGATTVITSARVLQNVTADAGIITSGRFPMARMPDGTLNYLLLGQGAGVNPAYGAFSDTIHGSRGSDLHADSHARLHALDSASDHSGTITDAQHGTKTGIPNAHRHVEAKGCTTGAGGFCTVTWTTAFSATPAAGMGNIAHEYHSITSISTTGATLRSASVGVGVSVIAMEVT